MDDNRDGVDGLTPRQREILRLFSRNMQGKEVARALNISERTVKTHTDAARRKLGAATTREAARMLAEYEAQNRPVPEGHRPSGTMDAPAVEPASSPRAVRQVEHRTSWAWSDLDVRLASISPLGWLGLILLTAFASALVVTGLIGGVLGLLDVMQRLSHVLPD